MAVRTEFLAHAPDFAAHLQAHLRVEVGKRFVEQQAARADDQRAGQRHALLLAAGKHVDLAVRQGGHPDGGQRIVHTLADFRLRGAAFLQTETQRCRPRSDAARARRTGTSCPCRADAAGRGSRPDRRKAPGPSRDNKSPRCAAKGSSCRSRSDRAGKKFARFDAQVEVIEDEMFAEVFAQVADGNGNHDGDGKGQKGGGSPFLTRSRVRLSSSSHEPRPNESNACDAKAKEVLSRGPSCRTRKVPPLPPLVRRVNEGRDGPRSFTALADSLRRMTDI